MEKNWRMSEWIDVKERLPGTEINWCIVLTINSDECRFGFMANYLHENGEWDYFDDDKGYENEMTVTHWQPLPEPKLALG